MKGPLTRRDALRRLMGGELRDRMRTTDIVEAYRALLRQVVRDLPFGVPIDRLPAPIVEIGDALVDVATRSLLDLPRRTLRDAYASLAHFRGPEEVSVLRLGSPLHGARGRSPEDRERSLELRRRVLEERARREREFDERVPRP